MKKAFPIILEVIGIIGFLVGVFSANILIEIKMALLISIIIMAIPVLMYYYNTEKNVVSGIFEWQWAGENMIGKVNINNPRGKVSIKVDELKCSHQGNECMFIKTPLYESHVSGEVTGNKKGFAITVPLTKYVYDGGVNNKSITPIIINANLSPVEAYAGEVTYKNNDGTISTGDMIIVKYSSSIKLK